MELVPSKDVYEVERRNTKKTFLPTDAICVTCGAIINSNYDDDCVICDDGHVKCDHKDFITGRQSVDLRILLDFHIEDLRALAELHGCSEGGGRTKTVAGLMKKLYSNFLDRRIDDVLIRKVVLRNRRKFWFWKDIESAMSRAKKSKGIPLLSAKDIREDKKVGNDKKDKKTGNDKKDKRKGGNVIKITEIVTIGKIEKKDDVVKVTVTPVDNNDEDNKK